ncbi:GtrA family protein [Falsiroseomonas sp. HW251]|uniref:GtrA family protein n=1 Tax=Falsiroseomonas sp. HW251 TaxID=3390998 RepID=UPI003D3118E1
MRPGPLRLLAFLGTGATNAALTYLLYLALLRGALLPARAAYTMTFIAGVALSTALNVKAVFGAHPNLGAIVSYTSVYLVVWGIGLLLVEVFTSILVPAELAPLLALPVTAGTAYLLSGLVLGRHRGAPE